MIEDVLGGNDAEIERKNFVFWLTSDAGVDKYSRKGKFEGWIERICVSVGRVIINERNFEKEFNVTFGQILNTRKR